MEEVDAGGHSMAGLELSETHSLTRLTVWLLTETFARAACYNFYAWASRVAWAPSWLLGVGGEVGLGERLGADGSFS